MSKVILALVALGASFAVGGGCGGSSSPYDDVTWLCFEDGASCSCHGSNAATPIEDPRPAVVTCRAELSCCFVKDHGDGTFDCACVVASPGEGGAGGEGGIGGAAGGSSAELDCFTAAIAHGSTEVVPRCPPVSLDDSSVCAVAYESCAPAYLNANGLVACCNGTTCGKDSHGQPVCVPS